MELQSEIKATKFSKYAVEDRHSWKQKLAPLFRRFPLHLLELLDGQMEGNIMQRVQSVR
jgi:hypothetical protein